MKNTKIAGFILAFTVAIASFALAEEYRFKSPDSTLVTNATSATVANALTSTATGHSLVHSVLVKPTATNSISNVLVKLYQVDVDTATNSVYLTSNTQLNGQTNTFEGMVWIPATPLYWGIGDSIKATMDGSNTFQVKVNWSLPLKDSLDDSTGL